MTTEKKVVHLTSAHPRYDTRIFIKMCSSLAGHSYHVSLVVADGLGDEINNNVSIIDVGEKTGGRLSRMTTTVKKVYEKAKALDADIYHLHDPELMPIGLKLKKLGKVVIFDAHENIALQIKSKNYIPVAFRKLISFFYRRYERFALPKMSALILAELSYVDYYKDLNPCYEVVLNMPDVAPLEKFLVAQRGELKVNDLFYLGGISNDRGLDVTLKALEILEKKQGFHVLHLIGPYDSGAQNQIDTINLSDKVKLYGYMNMLDGYALSKNSKVGISILKPIGNYIHSYSTKIFEYMAIGLPVITSDFELYKDVVEKYHCGICVNPHDSVKIAEAIQYIFDNPNEAEQMGENGRQAVCEKYNWKIEEEKLLTLYTKIV